MRSVIYLFVIFSLAVGFSGCSIKREVKPIDRPIEKEVCIIEDDTVREGFLKTYVNTLEEMGYIVKVIPKNSDKTSCKITSTYIGKWSWDLAIYLSYAKIDVYKDSKLVGSAMYDSTAGGGRIFDKFGSGSKIIRSLVEELYKK